MEKIICSNISKNYKNKNALRDVNLTIEPGKIYGLIGRNGAGKTTLLSLLANQTPCDSGKIMFGEQPLWENQRALSNICFSREILPANGSVSSMMKAKEYIKTASIYYSHWDKEYADKLIKLFELDLNKKMGTYSKGMLSMITIIVALASKSAYTFLDEPVAGLDIVARDMFYELLLDEYQRTGRTFIVSTHIIDEAADKLEEIIIIKDKTIMMKENLTELLDKAYYVSGKADEVDNAVSGLETYHEEINGRSKSVTVMLKEGQTIKNNENITVVHISLQKLFIALCGGEDIIHGL